MTILKKATEEVWKNTLVGENGTFNMAQPNHYASSPVFSEFKYLAGDFKQSREGISESQKAKIVEAIKRNPEKFLRSKAYQRLKDDQRIRDESVDKFQGEGE